MELGSIGIGNIIVGKVIFKISALLTVQSSIANFNKAKPELPVHTGIRTEQNLVNYFVIFEIHQKYYSSTS